MWCHMGQSRDTLHLPQILEGDVKVMATAFLCLSPLFPYLCFSYLSTFVLFVVVRTPQLPQFNLCTIISPLYFLPTSLQCSLFCYIVISPSLPKVQSSLSLQHWDKPKGFKNDIASGVFVSRQQQTENALPSHEVSQQLGRHEPS